MSAVDLKSSGMTLAPSTRGMGPNTYLGSSHFYATLGAALIVHLAILTIYSIWPGQKVKDIPVRALSFKIGGQERIAAYGVQTGVGVTLPSVQPQPVVAPPPAPKPIQAPVAKPLPVVKPMAKPAPVQRQRPAEYTPVQPVITPAPAITPVPAIPTPIVAPPAIAPEPQRHVREYGVPIAGGDAQGNMGQGLREGSMGGSGNVMLSPQAAEEIRTRYEQQISAWIERHKLYPAEAGRTAGRVLMRVRVDRQGYVRYYAIERGSGNTALDRAAIEMIRRANPMPAAPSNYPAEDLIEFLIPILFEAP